MTTAADIAVCKFHASLNVSDLNRSVVFYRVLLGREAAKLRPDYAKFELDDPPLVLSLIPSAAGAGGNLNHVGLRVSGSEKLVAIQRRIEEAGFPTTREDGVECCYARQSKFWVTDPDRTLWEIYVFHDDIDEPEEGSVPTVTAAMSLAKDVARPRVTWEHRIPEGVPESIPQSDNSVDEIHLSGTMNAKLSPGAFDGLIKDAFRALRPGGIVRLHGLAGDTTFSGALPALPGPAAMVEHVPSTIEVLQALTRPGFVDVKLEKLSKTAHFTIAGVPMREVVVVGRKPGYRTKKLTHQAVYLGPLAQVTDDFGNVFRRGERVSLNIHDWQVLSKGAAAEHFQFFEAASLAVLQEGCCGS
jgi:catechol 2,3-dioxygenase-like lactoylglutathione lyase family enzyme